MEITKLTQVGNSMAVFIPAVLRRELGWTAGSRVHLVLDVDQIILRRLDPNAFKIRKTTSRRGPGDITKIGKRARTPRD